MAVVYHFACHRSVKARLLIPWCMSDVEGAVKGLRCCFCFILSVVDDGLRLLSRDVALSSCNAKVCFHQLVAPRWFAPVLTSGQEVCVISDNNNMCSEFHRNPSSERLKESLYSERNSCNTYLFHLGWYTSLIETKLLICIV